LGDTTIDAKFKVCGSFSEKWNLTDQELTDKQTFHNLFFWVHVVEREIQDQSLEIVATSANGGNLQYCPGLSS